MFGSPFPTNAPAEQVLKRVADKFEFTATTKKKLCALADNLSDARKQLPDWDIPEQEAKALFQDYRLPVFEDLHQWSGEIGVKFEAPVIDVEQTRTTGRVVYQTSTPSRNGAGIAAQGGKSKKIDGMSLNLFLWKMC